MPQLLTHEAQKRAVPLAQGLSSIHHAYVLQAATQSSAGVPLFRALGPRMSDALVLHGGPPLE
jgi:hypothetical protein